MVSNKFFIKSVKERFLLFRREIKNNLIGLNLYTYNLARPLFLRDYVRF